MSEELSMLQQLQEKLGAGGPPVSLEHTREAILIKDDDLPWVDLPDGSGLKVLQVDLNQNIWVVKNRFKPGFCIDTHYHTGPVFAFTESGEWYYKEYPNLVNKAGSYLFEPAHSVHTLTVSPDATEDAVVAFVIHGSNVNCDSEGSVTSIVDAQTVYHAYSALCQMAGKSCESTIVIG